MTGALAIADDTLPSLVKEAAAVLAGAASAAEVLSAQDMATTIYDAAKRAARLQKAKSVDIAKAAITKQFVEKTGLAVAE